MSGSSRRRNGDANLSKRGFKTALLVGYISAFHHGEGAFVVTNGPAILVRGKVFRGFREARGFSMLVNYGLCDFPRKNETG